MNSEATQCEHEMLSSGPKVLASECRLKCTAHKTSISFEHARFGKLEFSEKDKKILQALKA